MIMLRWLRTDLGRAKYLLFAFLAAAVIAVAWVGKQSYDVFKLTRGVGDTWFYTADGKPWFRLDEQRHDVPIDAVSPHLQRAFVAVEDHRFFRHPGIDPIALARAVVRNVTSPGTVEGGSTITQQLARTLFPLGEIPKSEVRRIAAEIGLPNAAKKDSTGICFIGERPFREFLNRYLPTKPGPILTPEGQPQVLEWKTGKRKAADVDQVLNYALLLEHRRKVSAVGQLATIVYLREQDWEGVEVDAQALEDFRWRVQGDVELMRSKLADPERNVPLPMEEFKQTTDARKCARCYFRRLCKRDGVHGGPAVEDEGEEDA